MTQEEKAKRYDEAIERAKKWYNAPNVDKIPTFGNRVIEEIFPELKKSEDERIRKELITHCRNTRCVTEEGAEKIANWIAWLEKQCELVNSLLEGLDNAHERIDELIQKNNELCIKLEKQGEQKSVDKVEPRFHEGEWITNGDYTWKIVEVKSLDYILQSQDGNIVDDTISHVDEQFHSFTIEDAKDGDILVDEYGNIGIFEKRYGINWHTYCYLGYDGLFLSEGGSHGSICYLATKEQRDALFAKMKKAGYEWDAEKKELKKIESKFKVDDWVVVSTAKGDRVVQIASIEYSKDGHPSYFTTEGRWFGNGTKVRLLTDKDVETITLPESEFIVKQKSAWGEDDEKMCQETIDWFEKKCFPYALESENPARESIKWLKSLKDRCTWKPSEEQLDALKRTQTGVIQFSVLQNLYNDLKKL